MILNVPIINDLRKMVDRDSRPRRQIALAAKIHPNTFTAFMNKRRGLSLESAERLAEVLGHPIQLRGGK